jgi:hypothetical protein
MSASQSPSGFASIRQPPRPSRQSETAFSRVLSPQSALALSIFGRGKWGLFEKVSVDIDPMKSNVLGWLLGELRPPN